MIKIDRHKKLLQLSFLYLYQALIEHREICNEWNYSPKLKRILTNCKKAIEQCSMALKKHIIMYEKDKNKDLDYFNEKFKEYVLHKNILIKYKKYDEIIELKSFDNILPEDFIRHITMMSQIKNFIEDELKITLERTVLKEYKSFLVWYNKFDEFLQKEIFI